MSHVIDVHIRCRGIAQREKQGMAYQDPARAESEKRWEAIGWGFANCHKFPRPISVAGKVRHK